MIDNKTIAETIGEGPIGQELDKTDPQYKKFGGRKCHIVDVYPDYHNDAEAALRVLAWLGSEHCGCFCLCGNSDTGSWTVTQESVLENGNWEIINLWEDDTAPAAICAAFEWFVQQKESSHD